MFVAGAALRQGVRGRSGRLLGIVMSPPTASTRPPVIARAFARVMRPIERFLATQAASGVVLLVAAVVALVWANSRFASSYTRLWHAPLEIRFGGFVDTHD